MNIERFHNELAMRLGYERIVKDKRILISVENPDDPWVTLTFQGGPEVVRFKASGDADSALIAEKLELRDEMKVIVDAAHQAYIQATTNPF